TGLSAGTYTVTVKSCNGAETTTGTYTVNQPSTGMDITGNATPVICFGETTGTINITVTGGTINLPSCNLSYLWSNGATTRNLTGLGSGIYTVTVTDCNNCQAVESFTV